MNHTLPKEYFTHLPKQVKDEVEEWNSKVTKYYATSEEKDPNGIDAKTPGSKLDAGKSPVLQGALQYFPRALRAVSTVSNFGAQKYSWRGWESVPDGINRYGNAQARHLLDEATDGPLAPDSGLLHAAHGAWNALARLELILKEQEKK